LEKAEKMKTENHGSKENISLHEGDRTAVSPAVIRRLPRYFRYLRELIRDGKMRVSSSELSSMMNVTASQIRQDLNCFGGFGQQGYGYNVNYLYARICELLGVGAGIRAIIIGAGDLGRALVRAPMFAKRGVDIVSMFDIDKSLISRSVGDVQIRDMCDLEEFCRDVEVDMAVLTLPKESVDEVAERLMDCGIRGFWNFTGKDLSLDPARAVVENVHLGDSLMILCYKLCQPSGEDRLG
jgi:redox-sensing transcriptional repressor